MATISADHSTYHAIADPTRRAILELLIEGERSVTAILEKVRGSQSAISQHLGVLRRAGLVACRPLGRRRLYSIQAEPLMEVSDWVAHFDRFWTQRLDRLGDYLRTTHGEPSADIPNDIPSEPKPDRPELDT